MIRILMMFTKRHSRSPQNEAQSYGGILSVYHVINKILSRDANYIIDVFTLPKFVYAGFSMREGYDEKTRFFLRDG